MLTFDMFNDALEFRNLVDGFFRLAPISGKWREYPFVDLFEGAHEIEIRAIVPGISADEFRIELVDNSIVIEGEKKNDYSEHPYIHKERDFGKFKKTIRLSCKVVADEVRAELKDGILSIRLAKSEDAKPKKIEVH